MKKTCIKAAILASTVFMSTGAFAEGSMQHFGESAQHVKQSVQHTAGSIGNTVVGTSKLVSGVVAIPFKVIGSAATASNAVGDLLWDNATGEPELKVSDHTVTAGPAPMVAVNL